MTAPLDIGQLDQRVLVETQMPPTFDESGARLDSPVTQNAYWAAVSYSRQSGTEEDGRRAVREMIEVTLRWRNDFTRDAQVIWRGARYAVTSIEQMGTDQRWITMRCERDI